MRPVEYGFPRTLALGSSVNIDHPCLGKYMPSGSYIDLGYGLFLAWRGGRVVECGGLEDRYAQIVGVGGSNPPLSAP
jgi:hypothetical protein